MGRFGILARLVLIILSALIAFAVVTLVLLRWQAAHAPRSGPFLRVQQFAADVDLLDALPPANVPVALRALQGRGIRLALATRPPDLHGLIDAPGLEAKLHGFAHTPAAASARAYTSVDQSNRDPRDGVEGFMALAVATLSDGRFVVAEPVLVSTRSGDPLGLPLGLWIGVCGAFVAAIAVYGATRELRPLRALSTSIDAFDGAQRTALPEPHGAPDVRALIGAVGAMQDRVATLLGERTMMVGAVSHDLQTLLTRLQLRVAALADDATRTRLGADLDAMGKLVRDTLLYARAAGSRAHHADLDLADLAATEIAEREAVGSRLPIEARLDDAPVRADDVAMRRVLANLVDNAVRFGRTAVRVTTRNEDGFAALVVEDDGPGVPPHERLAVLLPFYRVEGSRNFETGGTGLGLAIASRIVSAHRGTLRVDRSELGGAMVIVRLPGSPAVTVGDGATLNRPRA